MPFGEMTITLDDVSTLLAIPVVGRTVTSNIQDDDDENTAVNLLRSTLGVTVAEASNELSLARGFVVRLEWLRSRFEGVTDRSDPEMIRCSARAYLLYMLGCTLFTDKTGTRVPVDYLHCLKDLESIHTYTRRAAALAYLYRQLGFASRVGVKQIAGYLSLLEGWIYEHFSSIAPLRNIRCQPRDPRIQHFRPRRETGALKDNVMALRETIDAWGSDDVCVYFYIVYVNTFLCTCLSFV